jgi:hypothetical protein
VITRCWIVAVLLMLLRGEAAAQRVVFHGEVTAVGQPPRRWTGRAPGIQVVDFDVEKVVTGSLTDAAIRVHFYLFIGDADADATQPKLRHDLFAPGKLLEVTAERQPSPTVAGQTIWVGVSPTREVTRVPPPVRRRSCLGCASSAGDGLGFVVVVLFLWFPRRKR